VNFAWLDDARLTDPQLQQLRAEVGPFLQSFLSGETSYLPREDYKEIIELCPLIWGFTLPSHSAKKQYYFRLPGAYHMARWVAKVIQILHEVFMIRNEFKLIAIERRNLSKLCIFAAHIYLPASGKWVTWCLSGQWKNILICRPLLRLWDPNMGY